MDKIKLSKHFSLCEFMESLHHTQTLRPNRILFITRSSSVFSFLPTPLSFFLLLDFIENITILHYKLFFLQELLQLLQASDILSEDVELQVDDTPDADIAEVGVFKRIWDDGYLEGVSRGIADGKTNPIHGYTALVDGKVTLLGHLAVLGIFEGEVGAAIRIVHRDAAGRLVDMSLYDMPVKPTVH